MALPSVISISILQRIIENYNILSSSPFCLRRIAMELGPVITIGPLGETYRPSVFEKETLQMNSGKISLSKLIFMALCCDMGILLKKLIAPAQNIVTQALHIPGGIGASASLMFIIAGAMMCDIPGCATLMCITQSLIALALGTSGSMGALAPIGYIVPGIAIDLLLLIMKRGRISRTECFMIVNALAGTVASLVANIITFRLEGPPLWLYVSVAFMSGAVCGLLGARLVSRVEPIVCMERS